MLRFYLGPIGYRFQKLQNPTRFYILYRVSPKVMIYPPKVVILPPISEFSPQNGSTTKNLVIYARCRQLSQVTMFIVKSTILPELRWGVNFGNTRIWKVLFPQKRPCDKISRACSEKRSWLLWKARWRRS